MRTAHDEFAIGFHIRRPKAAPIGLPLLEWCRNVRNNMRADFDPSSIASRGKPTTLADEPLERKDLQLHFQRTVMSNFNCDSFVADISVGFRRR